MNKKTYGGTSRALVIFAVALIAVLAVFAVYEFVRADSLTQTFSQAQSQLSDLTNKMTDMQQKYDSLQSQNAALQSQNATLQQPSPTPSATKDPNKKVAYLTFDDGPNEEFTPGVLKVLKQLDIKATFFISFDGVDTPYKRTLLKQEADDGYTLGVHCFNHSYSVCYKNEQAFWDDFNHIDGIIKDVTGITPKINRFPGGTDNTVSMTYSDSILMPTLEKYVTAMGFKTFDWNAGGEDADQNDPHRPTNAPDFLKVILNDINGAKDPNNLVVLIHDKFDFSAATVTSLVKELKKRGYTFDVLTPGSPDCMHPYAKPRSGLKDASDLSSASSSPSPSPSRES